MARRRIDDMQEAAGAEDPQAAGIDAEPEADPARRSKSRRERGRSKILITMSADVVGRLRHAAVVHDMLPGELVERLIDGPLRPYTMSIRGRRLFSEPGEAA